MEEKANQIIDEAIANGWKHIYLQNLQLKKIPSRLLEIENIEIVDLRANNIEDTFDFSDLTLNFDVKISQGYPHKKTVYLNGNQIVSNREVIAASVDKIDPVTFKTLIFHFYEYTKFEYCIEGEEEDNEVSQGPKIGYYQNVNADSNIAILQKETGLIKLIYNINHQFVKVITDHSFSPDCTDLAQEIFSFIFSSSPSFGYINHPCVCRWCLLNPENQFIFSYIYLQGFHRKFVPQIQCHQSGVHLKLNRFLGLKQPEIQIFVEWVSTNEQYYKELMKMFPRKGWGFNTVIWSQENIRGGDLIQDEYNTNFYRSDIFIFLLSPDLTSRQESWERLVLANTRLKSDKILLVPVEISQCDWEEGIKQFHEDSTPIPIKLKDNNWYAVAEEIHHRIEVWIKLNYNESN